MRSSEKTTSRYSPVGWRDQEEFSSLIDDRPDALLKSALEKIVYFEARSEQLANDLHASRAEVERCKHDLSAAAQREIELRRHVAEQEVRAQRAHAEREQMGRMAEALRAERAALIGKLIEASRIHGAARIEDDDDGDARFDLASFISELRSEALATRGTAAPLFESAGAYAETPLPASSRPSGFTPGASVRMAMPATQVGGPILSGKPVPRAAPAAATASSSPSSFVSVSPEARGLTMTGAADLSPDWAPSAATAAAPSVSAPVAASVEVQAQAPAPVMALAGAPRRTPPSTLAAHAERLHAEGRLNVSAKEVAALTGVGETFRGRTEETLFGFSVRELSAPDAPARIRAAERLKALAHPAAAPALATALHGETDPSVQVVLLGCFASFAHQEGVAIVSPLLSSQVPEVRVSALKALIALDASAAGPHLAAAMKDPDRAVRRRASLLALGLAGPAALELGEEAIRDGEPEVRSLAALVLGASGGERARSLLLEALRDPERKVRQAAAMSLSRILGHDVSAVVAMDDAQRRREIRRLASLPVRPVTPTSGGLAPAVAPLPLAPPAELGVSGAKARPSGPSEASGSLPALPPPAPPAARPVMPRTAPEALCGSVMIEIRTAIRGRTPVELAAATGASTNAISEACELLCARGQAVRRGAKFFAG